MKSYLLDADEIRYLILNGSSIKLMDKCDNCDGTGWENWNSDGYDIKKGKSSKSDRISGRCEKCNGVGFNWK